MTLFYWFLFTAHLILALGCSTHALLNKRDPRSAVCWILFCLFYPIVGPLGYCIFGINRRQYRAQRLNPDPYLKPGKKNTPSVLEQSVEPNFHGQAHLASTMTPYPLTPDNIVTVLYNGEAAYPAMLKQIEQAAQSVYLSTYIFDNNQTGLSFVKALYDAKSRGVDVRVLIDGAGICYSFPKIDRWLRKYEIPHARFHPLQLIPPSLHINLRNHRKILCVDGIIGFTGGMNIGDRHLVDSIKPSRVIDVHFQFEGPVVAQMQAIFSEDWEVATHEAIDDMEAIEALETLQPNIVAKAVESVEPITAINTRKSIQSSHGVTPLPSMQVIHSIKKNPDAPPIKQGALCRAIEDGPHESQGKIAMLYINAIQCATDSVWIMNPYFLPSIELILALQSASLKGVKIRIILPSKNNLVMVQWASQHIFDRLLSYGIELYYQPAPFVHSKLFVVDGYYTIVGSVNLDTRSLRLNFEMVVEIYNAAQSEILIQHMQEALVQSTKIKLQTMSSRNIMLRVRDGLAWMFSPFL